MVVDGTGVAPTDCVIRLAPRSVGAGPGAVKELAVVAEDAMGWVLREERVMKSTRKQIAGALVAGGLVFGMGAGVAQADTPQPTVEPGLPGCEGNILATFNHVSGTDETNSRGPGFWFRDGKVVTAEIAKARSRFCVADD